MSAWRVSAERVCVWTLLGGWRGVCQGGMSVWGRVCMGCVCMDGGVCSERRMHTPPSLPPRWPASILLECILVVKILML